MLELLISGGLLMVPIGVCSVGALAIIIERSISLSASRVMPIGVLSRAIRTLDAGSSVDLGTSELARVLSAGLKAVAQGRSTEQVREVLAEAMEASMLRLEHSLAWLASIAAISPLLGLLGTVLGMIEVFAELMSASGTEVSSLAGGISEALVTTAAGLTVAIPSLLFSNHFERCVSRFASEMQSAARELVRSVT